MNKKILGGIIAGVLVVGGVVGTFMCTTSVKAGYVGVVYDMSGGIENKTLSQGWHVVSPTKKVTKYSVATEQMYLSRDSKEGSKDDESFMIPTSDGKTVSVDIEMSYHFDADKLPETFSRFKGQDGKDIEQTFIRGKVKAWASEKSFQFSVIDIYGEKRADLNKSVYEHVRDKFNEYGIVIDSVNFSTIRLDTATEQAIQNRINSQQELETSKIEKQKAEVEAEKARVVAQGESDAKLIKAQGEAKANDAVKQSLTPELVEYTKWSKWDGKLPTVDGGNAIVDIRNNQNK